MGLTLLDENGIPLASAQLPIKHLFHVCDEIRSWITHISVGPEPRPVPVWLIQLDRTLTQAKWHLRQVDLRDAGKAPELAAGHIWEGPGNEIPAGAQTPAGVKGGAPVRAIVETAEPVYGKVGQEPGAYRADRLPMIALLEVSKVLKEGAERHKDDDGNKWMGTPVTEHLNRALVHIMAHLAGDDQEDHLAHAATRLLFSLQCHVAKKTAR